MTMQRSRLLETTGFNQLAKGQDRYFIYNQNDIYIGKGIEKYGEFCKKEMQMLERLCAPGDRVIEVGANIGGHTIGLARRVGKDGMVLAFEPQHLVYQTLCANVAINSIENVVCFWAAVGSKEEAITVPETNPYMTSNFGGVSLVDSQDGYQVDCYTLDRFISLPQLALIKIDVEGMEAEVIQGGRQLIQKFKPVLYVENDRPGKSEALMRLISGLGYRLYWHVPALFNPDNFYQESENIYPNIASFNMVCIHQDSNAKAPEECPEITDFTAHPLRR